MFAHVGDEGYVESCAADLARYRRHLEAEHVLIFTDIKKKHRHAQQRKQYVTKTAISPILLKVTYPNPANKLRSFTGGARRYKMLPNFILSRYSSVAYSED